MLYMKTGNSFVLFFSLILLLLKMSSEFHNTRLGMKQELHDFKNDFSTQLSDLSNSLNEKFDRFTNFLVNLKGKLKPTLMTLSQKV